MLPKKTQYRALMSALIVGVVAAFSPLSSRAADTIPILLCPFGCGPMAGDTILMNQLIKSGSDVVLLPQETPGYMYNIREMGSIRSRRKICENRGKLLDFYRFCISSSVTPDLSTNLKFRKIDLHPKLSFSTTKNDFLERSKDL